MQKHEFELVFEKKNALLKQMADIQKQIMRIDAWIENNKKENKTKPVRVSEEDTRRLAIMIDVVSEIFDVPVVELLGEKRKREIVSARHCLFYLASTDLSCSLDSAAALLSLNRKTTFNHATMIHARNKVKDAMDLRRKKGIDPDGFAISCDRAVLAYLSIKAEK